MFHHGRPIVPNDRVRARIERQVVEHDVAGGEAEPGVDARQRLDQVLANEIDFRPGLGLRIGHQHDVERLGLLLAAKREIDRGRQGPGRRETFEGQVQLRRRALGLMMAVEAGQIGLRLERRHEACGLDDEDCRLVRQRQRVAAVRAGDRDLAAVGDEDAGEPRIGGAGYARAVQVLEHQPRDLRSLRFLRRRAARLDRRQRKPARRANQHLAPRHSITKPFGHCRTSDC